MGEEAIDPRPIAPPLGMGNHSRLSTPPVGMGNREWGIVGMGNDEAGGGGGEKNVVGCGVGRSSSPIPHSRLPIPVITSSDPPPLIPDPIAPYLVSS